MNNPKFYFWMYVLVGVFCIHSIITFPHLSFTTVWNGLMLFGCCYFLFNMHKEGQMPYRFRIPRKMPQLPPWSRVKTRVSFKLRIMRGRIRQLRSRV